MFVVPIHAGTEEHATLTYMVKATCVHVRLLILAQYAKFIFNQQIHPLSIHVQLINATTAVLVYQMEILTVVYVPKVTLVHDVKI